MQYKVPQNVQQEDKIVGPLTMRQLIMCGIGGGLAYSVYVMFNRVYEGVAWVFLVLPIVGITIAFAFIRIYNVRFGKFLFLFLEMNVKPRRRVFKKGSAENMPSLIRAAAKTKDQKKAEQKKQKTAATIKNIQDITRIVDRPYANGSQNEK